ncbi:MAG: hypothetical protein ACI9FN_003920, partial [Saprospiraceae bacterium]
MKLINLMRWTLMAILIGAAPNVASAQEKGLDERINEWFTPIA